MNYRRSQIKLASGKMFAERGIAGTSVRDIAEGVGILSGSLYHYFDSKEAIARAILDEFLSELIDRYDAVLPHVEGLRSEATVLVRTSIEVAVRHPYATEIYQNERSFYGPDAPREIVEHVERAHSYWEQVASRAQEAGELRPDIEAKEFARVLRESVWSTVRFHREKLQSSGNEIGDTLVTLLIDGASPNASHAGAVSTGNFNDRIAALEQRVSRLEEDPSA